VHGRHGFVKEKKKKKVDGNVKKEAMHNGEHTEHQ